MLQKLIYLLFLSCIPVICSAQFVEVQADYNGIGDCIFSANNNAEVPLFLHINFGDIENTTFNEPLPYVKRLAPGYNDLFTLQRDLDADVPRFHYEIKTYRSDPTADADLDFPYLLPFKPASEVAIFDVKSIDGFWGTEGIDSWSATGFKANKGTELFACRTGIVVEITKQERNGDSRLWYHTWNNSLTVLHNDGTLICYHNINTASAQLKVGQKVYSGQKIGRVTSQTGELFLLIYHDSLFTKQLSFVIPQFVISETGERAILNSSKTYSVYHPKNIKVLEMNKRERKKILGKKN
ncbi:M23 family metallopeptidase [uncultured Draconibacterium sp.]|uniref:M23 family metallopeptidase n=1 Tax=uncultured Draconibacterium sp. TaxID=1573823 RepID=UPI003261CF58